MTGSRCAFEFRPVRHRPSQPIEGRPRPSRIGHITRAHIAITVAGLLGGLAAGGWIESESYIAATLVIVGWLTFFGVFVWQERRNRHEAAAST